MQPKYLSISQDDNRNKSYNDSQAKMCFMFTVKTAQWKKIDKITLDKKSPQRRNCRKNILSILQPALTVIFVAASNASGSSIDLCSPPSVKCSLTSDYHP